MKIIVIGGSAGSLEALREITQKLPASFAGSIFIVMHTSSRGESQLVKILNSRGALKSKFAEDNEKIEKGRIYVAPGDFHLVLERDRIRLTSGPKENWSRPAVDVLFRSAAAAYGQEVAAVVLSGNLYDGTAGLWAVKDCGGVAIVQDPSEALSPSMPANAMKNVEVDYCLPVSGIVELLKKIVDEKSKNKVMKKSEEFQWELEIANGREPTLEEMKKYGIASRYICPQCDGPLFEMNSRHPHQYRCVVGHAFSEDTLLQAVSEKADFLMAATYRTLQDKKTLLDNIKEEGEEITKEKADVQQQADGLKKLMKNKI